MCIATNDDDDDFINKYNINVFIIIDMAIIMEC